MVDLRTTTTLALARAVVRAHALLGDPAAQLFGRSARRDPYPVYERVRASGTLPGSRLGVRITASHRVCSQLVRDQRFGTVPASALSPADSTVHVDGRRLVNPVEESFLSRNPPEHTRLRKLVAPFFTPRALRGQTPVVEHVVEEFLDEIGDRPTFDLIGDFAARVPVRVITDLLGVPDADHASFARWGAALVGALDGVRTAGEMRALHEGLREFDAFLTDLVEQRGRTPGDDVVSALVAVDDLAADDLIATTELLLVAGFETTVNLIGNAARAVMAHDDVRAKLLDDPAYAEAVVEETLRFDPPVQYTARSPLERVEVEGVELAPDTPVVLLLAAANRDPEVFAEPRRFDPGRSDGREHLAFSAGIHYCLGANLARMEAAAALRGLFRRYPRLRIDGRVRMRPSGIIRGAARVPVRA
ncbi:cytochrome P450 [Umezawaea beigongshangensis]|uniref:cytochrome P450 n=1 Tax=Umezawaea beigongshangensis TaxID=2780383 RepID=UPI0018F157B9|nr:cytochrome P450 [Umezawaea beigongshangensis]